MSETDTYPYDSFVCDASVLDDPSLDDTPEQLQKERALQGRGRRGDLTPMRLHMRFLPQVPEDHSIQVGRVQCIDCQASWDVEELRSNSWSCPGCSRRLFWGTLERPCPVCSRRALWSRRGNQIDPLFGLLQCQCISTEQRLAMAARERGERVERMAHLKKVQLVHAMVGCYAAQQSSYGCCNHPRRDLPHCKVCPVLGVLGGKDMVLGGQRG